MSDKKKRPADPNRFVWQPGDLTVVEPKKNPVSSPKKSPSKKK